jgi:hypothetical protein
MKQCVIIYVAKGLSLPHFWANCHTVFCELAATVVLAFVSVTHHLWSLLLCWDGQMCQFSLV